MPGTKRSSAEIIDVSVSTQSRGRAQRLLLSVLACVVALGCTVPAEQDDDDETGTIPFPTGGTPPPAGGTAAPPPTTPGAPTAGAAATEPPPTSTTPTPTPTAGAGGASGDVPPATTPVAGGAATPVEPTAGTAAPPPMVVDHGEGDGSDVVTIGDSWMSYLLSGGGIEGALSRAGKNYRGYGVAGTTLLSGQIPGQYTRAKGDGPISTVIMTGGGNDIMFSGGCSTPEACKESLQALSDGLNELWTTMSNDGVKDVVYIRYAKGAGTTNSANLPTEPPTPPQICITGPIRCTSVDTTDAVMGQLLDGIHPTSAANDRIVEALLPVLEMKGIRR